MEIEVGYGEFFELWCCEIGKRWEGLFEFLIVVFIVEEYIIVK